MKEEKDDELVAVINIEIGNEIFIVPIDNYNKAIAEGRNKPVILGEELHFFTEDDFKQIKEFMNKKNK